MFVHSSAICFLVVLIVDFPGGYCKILTYCKVYKDQISFFMQDPPFVTKLIHKTNVSF